MNWNAHLSRMTAVIRDKFGETVIYTPAATGVPESITGVFDEAYRSWEVEGGTRVMVTAPVLTVRLADLSVAPKVEDLVTVSDRDWQVTNIEPDGSGMAVLRIVEVG